MSEPRLNINDQVGFRPTSEGLRILADYQHRHLPRADRPLFPVLAADGLAWMSIWEMAAAFGPHLFNGGPQLIVNNELTLKARG